MTRLDRNITTSVLLVVILLASAAFALSFAAQHDLATVNGVPSNLAWLFPLIVDGAIIVFSVVRFAMAVHGESFGRTWPYIGLIILATAASAFFNWQHATAGLSQIIHLVPPVALFAATETAAAYLEYTTKRKHATVTLDAIQDKLAAVTDQHKQATKRLTAVTDQLHDLDKKLTAKQLALQTADSDLAAQRSALTAVAIALAQVYSDLPNQQHRRMVRHELIAHLVASGTKPDHVPAVLVNQYGITVHQRTLARDLDALNGRITVNA